MAAYKKLEDIIVWQKVQEFCNKAKNDQPAFIQKKELELLNL